MDPPPPPKPKPAAMSFPSLEILDPTQPHTFYRPSKCINEGPDVSRFLTSKAYRDIGIFLLQLNRALCPRVLPPGEHGPGGHKAKMFSLNAHLPYPETVRKLQTMLERMEAMIEEAPPDPGPRRFGNISFRRWHGLLEERADALLAEFLPEEVLKFGQTPGQKPTGAKTPEHQEGSKTAQSEPEAGPIDELNAYFIGGFGSSQRLDYGTGHELSFLAFLGCLWKLGAFKQGTEGAGPGDVERFVVLGVIEPYLKVIRHLILTYTLEPAGSHGVWGLDDHSFIPFIFGSAQLTRPITESDPMPQEGSVLRAPKPADITKVATVELHRQSNMYFSAIGFINDVKKGPFWEHSPILFDVSGIKDGWGKINKGMIKMFNAEVLSKFPVVQHFPFGSLFSWERDPEAAAPIQTVHMANQPVAAAAMAAAPGGMQTGPAGGGGTAAPWAQATFMPGTTQAGAGVPYSKAPWASAGSSAPSLPRGGPPETGPPPAVCFAKGTPGTASNQFSVTKAPWAKDGS